MASAPLDPSGALGRLRGLAWLVDANAPPFARLARVHALSSAGDALIALALAGSLFFSIDPNQARWRVALYLLLTMAPFAVVAPLIGPLIDRTSGGARWMLIGSAAVRAVVALAMVRDLSSLLLFPEAFVMLVAGKSYQVARGALVPSTVEGHDALVQANSKLAVLGWLAATAAFVPGGLLTLLGSRWVVALACVVFAAATAAAFTLPTAEVATRPATPAEEAELRSAGILLAALAMALLRGMVGFLTFLAAFELRAHDAAAWQFGMIFAATGAGALSGAVIAPRLRRSMSESTMLLASLGLAGGAAVAAALWRGLEGAALLVAAVGFASSAGRAAFDSLVQRDAPDANQGRAFARFETRFQIAWVLGAFVPVAAPLPGWLGYVVIALSALAGGASFWLGRRATQSRPGETLGGAA
ncbi:MAG: MFS transporter [Acidimicrobiales bacterium]